MLLLFNLSLPRLSPANKESFEIIRVLLNIIDPDTVHYSHFSQHVTESHKHHHIPSTNSLITCLLLMKKNWFKDALTAPGNPFQIMHSLAISSNNILSVLLNFRPHLDFWSFSTQIPTTGQDFILQSSTKWMVCQLNGVWISVSHLKTLAMLLSCIVRLMFWGIKASHWISKALFLPNMLIFLCNMVYWTQQQLSVGSGFSCI